MYKNLNWTKLTADIEKQINYLIPIIKQDQTDYIEKLLNDSDLIQHELVNVEALQQNLSEILVEFEFSLKDNQIVIPYEIDVILLNTPSHGITFDLSNGMFNLNIPAGLLAKYQFNINNFVELKAYIMKKYGNTFNLEHSDLMINEFNDEFERHLYYKIEALINDAKDVFDDKILPKFFPNCDDHFCFAEVKNNPFYSNSDFNFKFNINKTDKSIILKMNKYNIKLIFERDF